MMDAKEKIYFCTKCAKQSREPMKECPICKSKVIGTKNMIETKAWKR